MKIKNKYHTNLAEIYDDNQWNFAFLSKDNKQTCHTFAMCRDFLHDIVRSALGGPRTQLYGMVYEIGKNPPIHLDKVKLVIFHPLKHKMDNLHNSLHLIHHYEELMGVPETKLTVSSIGDQDVFIITGDKLWFQSPQLLSLYTLLLRLGDRWAEPMNFTSIFGVYKALKEYADSDEDEEEDDNAFDYLYSIIQAVKTSENFDLFLKEATTIFAGDMVDHYPFYETTDSLHNYRGIVSFFTRTSLGFQSQKVAQQLAVF